MTASAGLAITGDTMNSDFAGARPGERRLKSRDECIREFAAGFSALRQERDQRYADAGGGREGALAVAMAATGAGTITPEVERIARKYQRWVVRPPGRHLRR